MFISVRGGLFKSHSISKGILLFLGAYGMVFTLQRIAWIALAHCVLSMCAGACRPEDTPLTQSVTLLELDTTRICAPLFRLCGDPLAHPSPKVRILLGKGAHLGSRTTIPLQKGANPHFWSILAPSGSISGSMSGSIASDLKRLHTMSSDFMHYPPLSITSHHYPLLSTTIHESQSNLNRI